VRIFAAPVVLFHNRKTGKRRRYFHPMGTPELRVSPVCNDHCYKSLSELCSAQHTWVSWEFLGTTSVFNVLQTVVKVERFTELSQYAISSGVR
jgi:hypothetical protein